MKKALRITEHLLPFIIVVYLLYIKYDVDVIERVFILYLTLRFVVKIKKLFKKNKK